MIMKVLKLRILPKNQTVGTIIINIKLAVILGGGGGEICLDKFFLQTQKDMEVPPVNLLDTLHSVLNDE